MHRSLVYSGLGLTGLAGRVAFFHFYVFFFLSFFLSFSPSPDRALVSNRDERADDDGDDDDDERSRSPGEAFHS